MVLGSEPADGQSTEPSSLLTMRMDVPNQDANKKNGQESIEFPYDLTNDVPEDVVTDMVRSCLCSAVYVFMLTVGVPNSVDCMCSQ